MSVFSSSGSIASENSVHKAFKICSALLDDLGYSASPLSAASVVVLGHLTGTEFSDLRLGSDDNRSFASTKGGGNPS
jgi:hypothetical protein